MLKSYLVTLSFVSGEYEQTFHKIFKANTTRSLDKIIDKYLATYYPNSNKKRDDLYFYHGGVIAIKIEDYVEITDLHQVIDRLASE